MKFLAFIFCMALLAIGAGMLTAYNGWQPPVTAQSWVRP